MVKKKILPSSMLFALTLSLSGCFIEPGEPHTEMGYKPVYGDATSADIKWTSPRTITAPGKIYVYGPYLLINEIAKGIHVYNNADPTSPEALGFISILGNTDMAIRDNVLFVDHVGQLVSLTIDDFSTIRETGRLALNHWNIGLPPPSGFTFECVDSQKGIVVEWKYVELKNPDCYAQ